MTLDFGLGIVKYKRVNAGICYVTLVGFADGWVIAVTEAGNVAGGTARYSTELIQHAFGYQACEKWGLF